MFGGGSLKSWRHRMKSYLQPEGMAFPGHEDGLRYHSLNAVEISASKILDSSYSSNFIKLNQTIIFDFVRSSNKIERKSFCEFDS